MSEGKSPPGADDSLWADLVVSILSVNQYSLERTYSSLQALRQSSLTDPSSLARWQAEEIENKLKSSGCDRGPFMTRLFAQRLSALGELIRVKGIDECESIIGSRDLRAIEALLLPVKGIGPVVLRNFYTLRDITTSEKHKT
jgi:endonuclease III-like uncharacterized protein